MQEVPVIKFTKVCKAFSGNTILKDVDLAIHKGESVVILGPSGSGKSVFLKHIIGFLEPDKGTVEINGQDWSKLAPQEKEELRYLFGMVFQDAALFDAYTLEENVAFPIEVRKDRQRSSAEIKKRTFELLDEVGLRDSATRKPADCSGGMQKRAGVARALAVDPEIILYDEPTTGLDVSSGLLISRLMREVHQKHPDVTTVTITHDYLCAALIADRTFYLDKKHSTLLEITDQIEDVRRQYEAEAERLENIRKWIEDKFEAEVKKEQQENIRKGIEDKFEAEEKDTTKDDKRKTKFASLFSRLTQGVAKGLSLIGQLFLLFFEMGLPLRMKDFLHRFITLGIYSFPLIFAAGFFVGMIGVVQFYVGVGGEVDTLPTPLPEIFSGVFLKILSPILVGFLLAGRVGSQVSAEIGIKRFGGQFDALDSLAISPQRFLLSPIVLTLAITAPIMSFLSTWAGIFGGYFIWQSFGLSGSRYWEEAFTPNVFTIPNMLYVAAKSVIIGIIVGVVSYQQGAETKKSSEDIADSTKNAVLIAFLLMVVFDFVANYLYALKF